MDQITHNVRRQNWLNIITQCQNRPSGTSVHQWCIDNEVGEKAYYYWLRKLRREVHDSATQLSTINSNCDIAFVEMPISEPVLKSQDSNALASVAVIRKNGIEIEINNSVSERLLSLLIKEVSLA